MATSATFLVLSDTHGFEHDPTKPYPLCQNIGKVDVVLHCGDLTQVGGISAYKKALKMLGNLDAELKLVIAGNHDISLDGEYRRTHLEEGDEPEEHNEAVELMTGKLAKDAKVTYLTEGPHRFTLRNGTAFSIFVTPLQPEYGDWAFGYLHGQKIWNIPDSTDVVMTHGPPSDCLDYEHERHLGCKGLREAVEQVHPLMHCFGHIHEGYGAEMMHWDTAEFAADSAAREVTFSKAGTGDVGQREAIVRGQSTLIVNAAIMNERIQPVNAPWLVHLPL